VPSPFDDPDLWRWGILALAAIGFVTSLAVVALRSSPTLEVAGRTVTKRQAIVAVLLWNAVGLPALAVILFAVWDPR
jgi:hypothetical protein